MPGGTGAENVDGILTRANSERVKRKGVKNGDMEGPGVLGYFHGGEWGESTVITAKVCREMTVSGCGVSLAAAFSGEPCHQGKRGFLQKGGGTARHLKIKRENRKGEGAEAKPKMGDVSTCISFGGGKQGKRGGRNTRYTGNLERVKRIAIPFIEASGCRKPVEEERVS